MTVKRKQQNDARSIEASDQNVDQTVDVGACLVLEDLFILKGEKSLLTHVAPGYLPGINDSPP